MKNIFIASILLLQPLLLSAADCRADDTAAREIQFPLTERDTETLFFYFNNEWIPGAGLELVEPSDILKVEIKDDEYGNRAVFLSVSPETLARIKSECEEKNKKVWAHDYPTFEFPGGNGKLKEWLDANIRIPEGYKGSERVAVTVKLHPDGSLSDARLVKKSRNDDANREALRLVGLLPKFRVKYYTPKKQSFNITIPITFREPGALMIRGGETTFIKSFATIEKTIKEFYANEVFHTSEDQGFSITDACTEGFLKRLSEANGYDAPGYATWLLRSGMQDGQDLPSKVLSVTPGPGNTAIVSWTDMGIDGSTTLSLVETDGGWKIDNATVPEGFDPL